VQIFVVQVSFSHERRLYKYFADFTYAAESVSADDPNKCSVDRFANMVREMSAQTQFIVITHSKRTMETASTLYGVTMEEPGISKIVSVRLN